MRPVLPDSSWYIAEARGRRDPLLQLAEISKARDIAVCGVVVAEVGRGILNRKALERFIESWASMCYVPSSQVIWAQTMEIAWQLDRSGRVLPLQDIHIAACALAINAVVLTTDQHFHEIPGIDATDRIL